MREFGNFSLAVFPRKREYRLSNHSLRGTGPRFRRGDDHACRGMKDSQYSISSRELGERDSGPNLDALQFSHHPAVIGIFFGTAFSALGITSFRRRQTCSR